jgi:two-component system LytT family response regulator
MKQIGVIIIDDERTARNEIKRLLAPYPEFVCVGEAKNVTEARTHIEEYKPDIIFLDIQLAGDSGFDLLESLPHIPEVIFTTAYEEYAVQAFEINALDYLMKPIREERFIKAIERAHKRIAEKEAFKIPTEERRIFIKEGSRCYFVQLGNIHLIESLENYACLHFEGKKALIKSSLNQLEEKLDENIFFRINRSQIINTRFIQNVLPVNKGRIKISLITGDLLELSDRQSVKFKSRGKM